MAKGYGASGDILTRTRDGQDLNAIWQSYQDALADFNATRQPLINLLASPVDSIIEDVVQPGQEKFEEATEFGIPVSIRPQPTVTQRAYPFKWYDTRSGYTFQFLAGGPNGTGGATAQQLDAIMNQVMEADNQLQFELVMKALFNSANRTAGINGTPYTVTALYNGDGAYIPPFKGQTFNGATHTHYLGSGVAGQLYFDPQDILDLAGTVEHHGFTRSNGYNILILMNPADAAAGPAKYVRNTAFNNGVGSVTSLYDFIPSQGQNTTLMLPPGYTLQGGMAPNQFAGLEVLGSWGPYLIVQDYQIPVGYMAAIATQGQSTATAVVGIREHDNPGLRGLVLRPGNNNAYPLIDSFYIRGMGTGVRQRGAAALMQLGTTYTTPTSMAW